MANERAILGTTRGITAECALQEDVCTLAAGGSSQNPGSGMIITKYNKYIKI
jgi:hypothetical protein